MEQTKKLNMTAMSDKTNSNTTAKKEEPAWEHKVAMKVSGVSIAVNLLLSLFKLLAGILAHSGAMISDAIHSASDVGSTFVVIVGVNLSSKKSDKEHHTWFKIHTAGHIILWKISIGIEILSVTVSAF